MTSGNETDSRPTTSWRVCSLEAADEIERLRRIFINTDDENTILLDRMADLIARRDANESEMVRIRARLAEWEDARAAVLAGRSDEEHCGCVAILRKELADAMRDRDKARSEVRIFEEERDDARQDVCIAESKRLVGVSARDVAAWNEWGCFSPDRVKQPSRTALFVQEVDALTRERDEARLIARRVWLYATWWDYCQRDDVIKMDKIRAQFIAEFGDASCVSDDVPEPVFVVRSSILA